MLLDSNTDWNLDGCRQLQLQLPHPDHPEDGHTDVVYKVHLKGNHLMSVSADQTARIWDLRTQRSLHPPLVGHTGSVLVVQFDAHSDVIITGDTGGSVMVWRFSTGEAVKTIAEAHDGSVLSLQFDQRYLVTGGKDGKIKLWKRHSLDVNHTGVHKFAVRPAEGDRYQEYSLLATFDGHRAPVNDLKLRDNTLVSGFGDSMICVCSLRTGEILHKVNIHQKVSHVSTRIYDVDQKVEVACLEGHTNLIRSAQAVFDVCAEVKTIISGSYDGSIRVWEQVPGSREWRTQHQFHLSGFQAHEDLHPENEGRRFSNRIFSVDFDADRFVCSGQGPLVRVWDFYLPT